MWWTVVIVLFVIIMIGLAMSIYFAHKNLSNYFYQNLYREDYEKWGEEQKNIARKIFEKHKDVLGKEIANFLFECFAGDIYYRLETQTRTYDLLSPRNWFDCILFYEKFLFQKDCALELFKTLRRLDRGIEQSIHLLEEFELRMAEKDQENEHEE